MTDGVVWKKGWLELGGYRLGAKVLWEDTIIMRILTAMQTE